MLGLTGAVLFPAAAGLAANVCGQGVGIPPFLSSGAKPNLLMVLDNSGSMLDAAYSDTTSCSDGYTCNTDTHQCDDKDKTTCGAFCFDDTYDRDKTYAGYFQNDQWYVWTEGTYKPWVNGKNDPQYDADNPQYKTGDRVYVQGVIWQAGKDGTSSGTSPADNTELAWSKVFSIDKWKNGATYSKDDIVWSGPQLYKALNTGTSTDSNPADGITLEGSNKNNVEWKAVDSTWLNGKSYNAGDIVSYKGVLYETSAGGTSNGTSLYDDTGVIWEALDEGSFVAVSMSAARTACKDAAGDDADKYNNGELCISINTTPDPDQVAAFAARGNLLNWAMASKFDVEKEILTGGKYNYKEQFLVNEHRGCSGSRLIKQLQIAGGGTDIEDDDKFLSLGVRSSRYNDAPLYEDRVDSTDDTGRLEVLAITNEGYQMSGDCQDAIAKIAKGCAKGDDTCLNGTQGAINKCITSFPDSNSKQTDMRPALNHTLQACWMDDSDKPGLQIKKAKFESIYQACEELYLPVTTGSADKQRDGYLPSELRPADGGAYICYGAYDGSVPDADRAGYVGRVWNTLGEGSTMTCNPLKPADVPYHPCPGDTTTCYWNNLDAPVAAAEDGNPMYMNKYQNSNDTIGEVYKCTGGFYPDTAKKQDIGKCISWTKMFKRSDGALYEGDQNCGISAGSTTGGNWENPAWKTLSANVADLTTDPGNGILKAIEDYCDALRIPEVIDPSDAAGKTSTTGGLPGLLRDSELMAFLGGKDPIATMKGYIYQAKRPEGVVHRVAGDLRLGMMSFRNVGAKTECDLAKADTTSKIDKYCPLENMDGALLRTPLEVGDYVTDSNDPSYEGNKRRHVDDLAEAINTTRGTSWTPLAEALYEAVGYYSQNSKFCLNCTDRDKSTCTAEELALEADEDHPKNCGYCVDTVDNCLDFPTQDNPTNTFPTVTKSDPIQYWCQDNHILVITEGESTADINEQVKGFSGEVATGDSRILSYYKDKCPVDPPLSCTCSPDKTNEDETKLTGDGDDEKKDGADDADCTGDGLYSSPYMDNMTWWGQNALPLYKNRCVTDSAKENLIEKQNIYTHIVTTGTLLNEGTGECNPKTLMENAAANGNTALYQGENPQKLEENLYAVFDDILSRSSAGSAASVISSSRSGAGAVYQAVFWPKFEDGDPDKKDGSNKVSWIGDVHSLFVSSKGLMYDDWNQNGKLDEGSGDNQILFYFSKAANRTRGCYDANAVVTTGQCSEPPQNGNDLVPDCSADNDSGPGSDKTYKCVELQDIKYLWSANKKLAGVDEASDETETALEKANKIALNRKLFTWNDLNNDGIIDVGGDGTAGAVDDDEWFLLNDKTAWKKLDDKVVSTRGPVRKDFVGDAEDFVVYDAGKSAEDRERNAARTLVRWLQGIDVSSGETLTDKLDSSNTWTTEELRSRQFTFSDGNGGWATRTWRLGDIIHSTPMVVAKPAELYHYIYRDPTYKSFADKWNDRRNMVYFGGNDGMLHAVNGGFFYNNQFCCTPFANGTCPSAPENGVCDGHPDLGEEMWAYIPYNLQPHLKCLADKFYAHKFYVDLKPRIFDVQIFQEDAKHPGGWGTILVGGMHFGGTPVAAVDLNDTTNDNRKFISAYFVLDITDPESEPVLLGEMTQALKKDENGNLIKDSSGNYVDEFTDMQYTASSPSMIIMREGGKNDVKSRWYLTLGSGPADMEGRNNSGSQGKLAVIPLSWLNGEINPNSGWTNGVPTGTPGAKQAFRIPDEEPKTGSQGGRFLVPWPNNDSTSASSISDLISVDYNIDLSSAGDDLGARYCTDAIYFGTVDGTDFEKYPSGYLDGAADQFYWNGGGRVFRLVTKIMTSQEDTNNNGILDDGEDLNNNGVLDTFVEAASLPSAWKDKWADDNPLRELADVKMPVVGAQSVGYDGWNYWVYAGTGRFFGEKDKTDDGWCLNADCSDKGDRSKAALFGFKEPLMDANDPYFAEWDVSHKPSSGAFSCEDRVMTWEKIEWDINDDTNDDLPDNVSSSDPPVPSSNEAGKRGLMRTDNILVEQNTGNLYCYYCGTDPADPSLYQCGKTDGLTGATLDDEDCFPGGTNGLIWDAVKQQYTFDNLKWYIAGEMFNPKGDGQSNCLSDIGTGLDGWYHAFHDPRERNLGASALLGGLLTFTTYQPFNDKCQAEGQSYLYGIHFQTGTAWTETVFGTFDEDVSSGGSGGGGAGDTKTIVKDKMSLGRGLSTTPSMHVGSDGDNAAKAFIQTSTGEIIEVEQKHLPIKAGRSGRQNWNDRLSD